MRTPNYQGRVRECIVDALRLDQLYVVCPGKESYPVTERISVLSVLHCPELPARVADVV